MWRRRRQNRKTLQEGSIFPAPLALILAAAMFFSLGYLWLCDRCQALGRHLQNLEARRDELQRQVLAEEYKWANLKSPQNIERLLAHFQLDMRRPTEACIVRLRRPDLVPAAPGQLQYAQTMDGLRDD